MAIATPTIDNTVGGASANSYLSLAEVDLYLGNIYHTDGWDDLSDAQKTFLIVNATAMIDRLNWDGAIASDSQKLRWPRTGIYDADGREVDDDIIPDIIKQGTAELALSMMTEDRNADSGTEGFSKIKADVIELTIDKNDRKKAIPNNVIKIVAPFLKSVSTISGNVARV